MLWGEALGAGWGRFSGAGRLLPAWEGLQGTPSAHRDCTQEHGLRGSGQPAQGDEVLGVDGLCSSVRLGASGRPEGAILGPCPLWVLASRASHLRELVQPGDRSAHLLAARGLSPQLPPTVWTALQKLPPGPSPRGLSGRGLGSP